MTLQRGRLLSDADNENAAQVAVINETMAKTYWPNENPIGKHLKLSRRGTASSTVVGVLADTRAESLEDARVPEVYTSLYQRGAHHLAIFLRGHFDMAAIADEARKQVQSVDPTLPVFGAQTLSETMSTSLAQRRFSMKIVALFAAAALLLSALGIYGVISYIVNERTQEIGIRLALGAAKRSIMHMILRQGIILAITGAGIGVAGALIMSHLMTALLYGVKATDAATFAAGAFLLVLVALAACYIPARRAVRIDPLVAVRHE
jgi:predicted permease